METRYRYGFYIRPDHAMSAAITGVHAVLRAQYGLVTAGLFPPHVTVKGFFRSDATVAEMVGRLTRALQGWEPFEVYNNGVARPDPDSLVLSIEHLGGGRVNMDLHRLQDRAWAALLPLVHPGCEFTPKDPRGLDGPNPYRAHLTLAQEDLPRELQSEVYQFVTLTGGVGPSRFAVDTCHLYRFEADWTGGWANSLEWTLLHSFRAGAAGLEPK